MMKAGDDIAQTHLAGCIRAFLEGKKNLNWVMAFVRGHRLPPSVLRELIEQQGAGADVARYESLVAACRYAGLM